MPLSEKAKQVVLERDEELLKEISDIINQAIIDTIDLPKTDEDFINKSKTIVSTAAMKTNIAVKVHDMMTTMLVSGIEGNV